MNHRAQRRRWDRFRDSVQSRVWPLPSAAIVVAVVLGVAIPTLDRLIDDQLGTLGDAVLFAGEPDSARGVLTTIASSVMTVTSLTFSLTVVALQLASSQASPRLLRLFASDRRVHVTLALFLGTFAFSLTVLRSVQSPAEEDGDPGFVPRLAVSLAFVLALASMIALTLFLGHLAARLRVETMLRDVHTETSGTIRSLWDDDAHLAVQAPREPAVDEAEEEVPPLPEEGSRWTLAERGGFLVGVERHDLLALAVEEDLLISVDTSVGDDVVAGVPIARWWPKDPLRVPHDAEEDAERTARIDARINAAHLIDYERTAVQDLGFGLRQLVDVAVKALSPGVNDPTTAVHALGHVSAVLGEIVARPVPSTVERDDDGGVRVIGRQLDLEALVALAVDQPRRYGAADAEVAGRLLRMLRELAWVSRHPSLVPTITAHADAVLAASMAVDRTPAEQQKLAAAHRAALAATRGEWMSVR